MGVAEASATIAHAASPLLLGPPMGSGTWAFLARELYGYVYDTEACSVLGTTSWLSRSPLQRSGNSSNDTKSIQSGLVSIHIVVSLLTVHPPTWRGLAAEACFVASAWPSFLLGLFQGGHRSYPQQGLSA